MEFHLPSHNRDHADISKKWRFLSGSASWAGLLNPLDDDLRRYILHYGELAEAAYDAFDSQKESIYAGSCLFSKRQFFSNVFLENGRPYRYEVTRFLYATSGIDHLPDCILLKALPKDAWMKKSNWIGYVAVADDDTAALTGRRDVMVAWRGTVQATEWVNDILEYAPVPAHRILGNEKENPSVHEGWYSVYTSDDPHAPHDPRCRFNKTSARDQVLSEIKRLVEQYKDEEVSITITGHSLGAALATLNAVDIVANGINHRPPTSSGEHRSSCLVTAIVFASPRVGDSGFKRVFTKYAFANQLKVLRVKNIRDIVPKLLVSPYEDVGVELAIDTNKSPFLKRPCFPYNMTISHSLEVYLHGVAGTHGRDGGFDLAVDRIRDVALVNKAEDFLNADFKVPASWWVIKNKGMVQQADGSWKTMERDLLDDDFF